MFFPSPRLWSPAASLSAEEAAPVIVGMVSEREVEPPFPSCQFPKNRQIIHPQAGGLSLSYSPRQTVKDSDAFSEYTVLGGVSVSLQGGEPALLKWNLLGCLGWAVGRVSRQRVQ